MPALDDIAALLQDADDQFAVVSELHDAAFAHNAIRSRFKARLKNVLENLRSSLDYLAVDITERYGVRKGLVYYPMAQSEREFPSVMDGKMPGVRTTEPAIADAIQRHQPYQPGHEWLRHLSTLTREQKHNRLTLQLVRETYRCRVTEKQTGAFVEWEGLQFGPPGVVPTDQGLVVEGAMKSPWPQLAWDHGKVNIQPQPDRDANAPKPLQLGVGPTAVEVFGVPLDMNAQLPYPSDALEVEKKTLYRWYFVRPHVPVLMGVEMIRSGVAVAVKDIAQSACL